MAVKFIKVCGLDRPRTKLDLGRVTKKVTKIRHPGCCAATASIFRRVHWAPASLSRNDTATRLLI